MSRRLSMHIAEENPLQAKGKVPAVRPPLQVYESDSYSDTRSSSIALLNGEKLLIRISEPTWPEGSVPVTLLLPEEVNFPAFLFVTNYRVRVKVADLQARRPRSVRDLQSQKRLL
jgi:hypothetical protein